MRIDVDYKEVNLKKMDAFPEIKMIELIFKGVL